VIGTVVVKLNRRHCSSSQKASAYDTPDLRAQIGLRANQSVQLACIARTIDTARSTPMSTGADRTIGKQTAVGEGQGRGRDAAQT
jgi:hypothetical protein